MKLHKDTLTVWREQVFSDFAKAGMKVELDDRLYGARSKDALRFPVLGVVETLEL